MHELLLFGQVPRSRHEQILKVLAGIAAMQPQRVLERHVLYRPNREPQAPGRTGQVGGSQNVASEKRTTQTQAVKDLYYLQLVQELEQSDFSNDEQATPPKAQWALQFYDMPDAARRPVVKRLTNTTQITQGDAHGYMKNFQYDYELEYILEGHRFVHKNVVLLLHRTVVYRDLSHPLDAPRPTLPGYQTLKTVDASGAYLLQACVRLESNAGPENDSKGQDELLKLQNILKGVVDLKPADRLELDSRLKYMPDDEKKLLVDLTQAVKPGAAAEAAATKAKVEAELRAKAAARAPGQVHQQSAVAQG